MNKLSEELVLKNSKRKQMIDKVMGFLFLFIALICASVIVFTLIFILIKGLSPFINTYTDYNGNPIKADFWTFISGTTWTTNNYGSLFLLVNTLFATFLSLIISVPVSILTAIFVVRICPKILRPIFETGIDMLSSIPSVIYGLFGMGIISPFVRDLAKLFGLQTAGGTSLLSGVIVLAIMSIPTITIVSITSLKSVSKSYVEGSVALGATASETNFKVVLRGATSGIISGIILGTGRALGEATAISLVIGNASSGPTFNPFDIASTLTTAMFLNLGEATGLGYDIRFSLGLQLMIVIVIVNFILNSIKNRVTNPYKKQNKFIIALKAYFEILKEKIFKKEKKNEETDI